MGLLGKTFNSSKFRTLVNIAITRIAFLEKKHHLRCSQARSDVLHLLTLGHQESALLRVEVIIREQNMLDAYAMIENYMLLLVERLVLIQKNRRCPQDLKEATASLIFAASRYAELPELQQIARMLKSRFGKELATRAVQMRNNCGVNPKIVGKLSTQPPSYDSKLKALRELTSTKDILSHLDGEPNVLDKKQSKLEEMEKPVVNPAQNLYNANKVAYYENMEDRVVYGDVKDAAHAAYRLAANAAIAARQAVELSRVKGKGFCGPSN